MADPKTFEEAMLLLKTLPEQRPDVLLKMYGLYKQATLGDVTGKRPGMLDFRGQAKYDAWAEFKGQTTDQAKAAYVAYVEELVKANS